MRRCTLTVTGKLYNSPTGYYSANLAIQDGVLEPDASCQPLPPEPDLSRARVPSRVTSYHVLIDVDYRDKGHVDVLVWQGRSKRTFLRPWQGYADYLLTGARDVLWFGCAEGFLLSHVVQTPRATDAIFHDQPDQAGTSLVDLEA